MARYAPVVVAAVVVACAPAVAERPPIELPAPVTVVDVAGTTALPPARAPTPVPECPSGTHWDAKAQTCILPLPSEIPTATPHPGVLADPCGHLEAPDQAFFDCDPAQGEKKMSPPAP
jgi:hypothetical protein